MKPFFFALFDALLFPAKTSRRRPKARIFRYEPLEARCMLTPVAVNDPNYQTAMNTALTVNAASGVKANDSDPQMLPFTCSVVANPAHGSLSLGSDGSFTYTPTSGYTGTDSFMYHDTRDERRQQRHAGRFASGAIQPVRLGERPHPAFGDDRRDG
jgi:hypothetical protein